MKIRHQTMNIWRQIQNYKITWTETGQQAFSDGIFKMSLEPFIFEVAKPQCENTNLLLC